MIRSILLSSAVLVTLAGCARVSESRFNPLNWFGPSQEAPRTASGEISPLIPENRRTVSIEGRALAQSVTSLSIDSTPSGAIVRATGIAPTQGFFNAELVSAGIENGVLMLEFRAQAPTGFQAEGSARSRQINAAYVIDATELSSIRSVRVQAADNARTSSR